MNAISTLNAAPTMEYAARFAAATGWLWNDAVDEAIECALAARDFAEADRLRGLKLPASPVLMTASEPLTLGWMSHSTRIPTDAVVLDEEIAQGWTFADAMEMACEIQRENRIFGRHGNRSHKRRNRGSRRFSHSAFERATGWTMSDAIDEAATLQRERRIFGNN